MCIESVFDKRDRLFGQREKRTNEDKEEVESLIHNEDLPLKSLVDQIQYKEMNM